jgi:hypothetical protein
LSSLQKKYEPQVIAPASPEQKKDAEQTHKQIVKLISDVKTVQEKLEHSFVTLGKLMFRVQAKVYWETLGYKSWKEYMDFLQNMFDKGRTQLYGYLSTVKTLSDHVDDETMDAMGISKSKELKRAVAATGKSPSEELLKQAVDPKLTVSDLREKIHKEFNIVDHVEPGVWFDINGFFLLEDEKEEMLNCFDIVKKLDPPISQTLPAHVQMKEVLMRLVQNFMADHAGLGEDPFQ